MIRKVAKRVLKKIKTIFKRKSPKILAFGGSTTEIFDYIFGKNPDYYSFWASSASARGLRKLRGG